MKTNQDTEQQVEEGERRGLRWEHGRCVQRRAGGQCGQGSHGKRAGGGEAGGPEGPTGYVRTWLYCEKDKKILKTRDQEADVL